MKCMYSNHKKELHVYIQYHKARYKALQKYDQ